MSLRTKIIKRKEYLVANFAGQGTLDEISRQFSGLAEQCRVAKLNKLLINISALKGTLTVAARYQAGERAVTFLSDGIKLAVVGTTEQKDPGLLGELVARNRGVNVRVFTDLAEAKRWLLEKAQP
jgi:hypothetical protein